MQSPYMGGGGAWGAPAGLSSVLGMDRQTAMSTSGAQAISDTMNQLGSQLKETKAYRAMAVDALGMDPDKVDKMSLGELKGHMQALAVRNQQEQTQALAQERMAKAALLTQQQEEAQAMPAFAQELMRGRASGPGGGGSTGAGPNPAEMMSPGAGAAGIGPTSGTGTTGASGAFSPDEIMGAMGRMGATNPRMAGAMMRVLIPKLMNGEMSTGPQSWTSPGGNPYVFMNRTIMPDRPPVDMQSMMGTAPEGYSAVPTGPNRMQYLKTGKELPPTFHSVLDQVQSDIAGAQSTLERPDGDFVDANGKPLKPEQVKAQKASAQRRLEAAQKRGKATVDRYHTSGYFGDDERTDYYGGLGIEAPAAAAKPGQGKEAAASGNAYKTPADVKAAVAEGKLERAKGTQILREQFGFQ